MLILYRFVKLQFSVQIGLHNNLGLHFNPDDDGSGESGK